MRTRNIARRWWLATVGVALLWLAGIGGVPLLRSLNEPPLPIRELRGAHPGPTVALVAGVHGGKVAAVHALDRLADTLDRSKLHGTVLLVGPANRSGYRAGLAQTSPEDSLNLNRVFPGRWDGSYTERLAAKIIRDVVQRSDFLIDMHGSDGDEAVGRFAYAARPGITPWVDSAALMLAMGWGMEIIVWDETGPREFAESRFLQTAAHLRNVPAITVFEKGSTRVDSAATAAFVAGALNALRHLDVVRDHFPTGGRFIPLRGRQVTLAQTAGEWTAAVSPERPVWPSELVGVLVTPAGADSLYAPERGFVLHQRLSGTVAAGTPLVILGLLPEPRFSPPVP